LDIAENQEKKVVKAQENVPHENREREPEQAQGKKAAGKPYKANKKRLALYSLLQLVFFCFHSPYFLLFFVTSVLLNTL
jgi:hypothetical protein